MSLKSRIETFWSTIFPKDHYSSTLRSSQCEGSKVKEPETLIEKREKAKEYVRGREPYPYIGRDWYGQMMFVRKFK